MQDQEVSNAFQIGRQHEKGQRDKISAVDVFAAFIGNVGHEYIAGEENDNKCADGSCSPKEEEQGGCDLYAAEKGFIGGDDAKTERKQFPAGKIAVGSIQVAETRIW